MTVLLAVLAGGLGAIARLAVTLAVRRWDDRFPWGTAVVNISGAAALGLVAGLVGAGRLGTDVLLVVGGGFLGAYTTFSTWMVETVDLALGAAGRSRGTVRALANILGPLAIGVLCATAGYLVGGTI